MIIVITTFFHRETESYVRNLNLLESSHILSK